MTTPVMEPVKQFDQHDKIFTQGSTDDAAKKTEGGADASLDKTDEIKKPIYEGLGVSINTQEELIEYAKRMEAKAVQATINSEKNVNQNSNMDGFTQPQQDTVVEQDKDQDIENMIFTNPKKALDLHGQAVEKRINEKFEAKKREEQFWTDFYVENPDLRNADLVVKSITGQRWAQISKLPLGEAKKIIVQESRSQVLKIRGETGTKTELQRTSSQSLPASGGSLPQPAVVQEESTNFITEVRKMQAKKRS